MKSCIKLNSIFLDERLSFLQLIQERRQKRKVLYLHAAIKIQAPARGLMLRSVLESTILDAKKRKRARSELQSSLACLGLRPQPKCKGDPGCASPANVWPTDA